MGKVRPLSKSRRPLSLPYLVLLRHNSVVHTTSVHSSARFLQHGRRQGTEYQEGGGRYHSETIQDLKPVSRLVDLVQEAGVQGLQGVCHRHPDWKKAPEQGRERQESYSSTLELGEGSEQPDL